MIVQTPNNEIERSGNLGQEQQFTIKSTDLAFDILSSGLYSDKIKAIIRELSCNAYDAHVSVGKGDVPIEIQLPTLFDLTFAVTDFGPGLTHEQMVGFWEERTDAEGNVTKEWVGGIYNTYFESTKQHSNDFIGQMGLGSKSPFSYASAFNVESRQGGVSRVYSCYKNEHRKPVITLMATTVTSKPDGMTITMACKRDDVEKFKIAAKSALMYFKPAPNVTGQTSFTPHHLEHTVKGSNWRVRKTDTSVMTGPYVVQGFVPYPIDVDLLNQNGLSPEGALVVGTNIDFYVPIGDVRSSASREHLQYDPPTIRNLISAIDVATEEMRVSFQAQIDECKTQYEAAVTHDKLMYGGTEALRKLYSTLHKSEKFRWNDMPVDQEMVLDLTDVKSFTIHRYRKHKTLKRLDLIAKWDPSEDLNGKFAVTFSWNTHFFFDPKPSGSKEKLRMHMLSLKSDESREPQLFVIRPVDKSRELQAKTQANELAKTLGVNLADASALASPARSSSGGPVTARIRRPKDQCLYWCGFPQKRRRYYGSYVDRKFSRRTWELRDGNYAEGGVYVNIMGYYVVGTVGLDNYHFDQLLDDSVAFGFIPSTHIRGFTDKERTAAKAAGEWTEVTALCKEKFIELAKTGIFSSKIALTNFSNEIGSAHYDILKVQHAELIKLAPAGPLADLMEELDFLRGSEHSYKKEAVDRMYRWCALSQQDEVKDKVAQLKALWTDTLKLYPLLGVLPSVWKPGIPEAVGQYLNLIDGAVAQPKIEVTE